MFILLSPFIFPLSQNKIQKKSFKDSASDPDHPQNLIG